jgi:hypothetical protein
MQPNMAMQEHRLVKVVIIIMQNESLGSTICILMRKGNTINK